MTTQELILKAKKQVYSDRLGNHASWFQGEGFEFSELREYVHGDDVRKIDWKTTAKLSKPYVKIYREERELNVVVATMLGGACAFGTVRQKSELMREIVSLVGMSTLKYQDNFSHFLFADKMYEWTKPTKKELGVYQALEAMNDFDMIGKGADFEYMQNFLRTHLGRKSLLIVISDFIGSVDFGVLSKKHDIIALIVRDKFEENPIALGGVNLLDMESLRLFNGVIDEATIRRYQTSLYQNDDRLQSHFKHYGIRWVKIYTDENPYLKLRKSL